MALTCSLFQEIQKQYSIPASRVVPYGSIVIFGILAQGYVKWVQGSPKACYSHFPNSGKHNWNRRI